MYCICFLIGVHSVHISKESMHVGVGKHGLKNCPSLCSGVLVLVSVVAERYL
jgi:hypothetical protein